MNHTDIIVQLIESKRSQKAKTREGIMRARLRTMVHLYRELQPVASLMSEALRNLINRQIKIHLSPDVNRIVSMMKANESQILRERKRKVRRKLKPHTIHLSDKLTSDKSYGAIEVTEQAIRSGII